MTPLRATVSYAVILGTLPYLTLKVSWLTGGRLGIADPELMNSPALFTANLVTGGMDLVAIVIALALTHRWGQKLPAWLVLFPAWVGTGFLLPIVLSSPAIGMDFVTNGTGGTALEPWVTPVVYASFTWQGVTLLAAFTLYVRSRWPHVFRHGEVTSGDLGPRGLAGAVLAVVACGFHVTWAITGDLTPTLRVVNVVHGALALAAAVGILALSSRFRGSATVAVWIGSAGMFSWGMWTAVTELGDLGALVQLGKGIGGVLLGLALLDKARDVARGRASQPTRTPVAPG
ncbi:hypothetical protein BAY61_00460 [Prauserella marina]|nr:hypothetical protein [Prauserella marina]ASR33710.1 hypothetical protein BAY61_00460 [Prauserella marina]